MTSSTLRLALPGDSPPNVIHLSDLHLRDATTLRNAQRLVDHIAWRFRNTPTLVVLTGDIIDTPDPGLWTQAETLLRPLRAANIPVVACPGNHDVAWMGLVGRERYRTMALQWLAQSAGAPPPELSWPRVYRAASLSLILCDSNQGHNKLATGQLGYPQRMALALACQSASERGDQVIVALHHHPMSDDPSLRLKDADALLHLLSSRCDVLLCGHLHQAAAWSEVWGIRRVYAADASTRSLRYRHLWYDAGRWLSSWVHLNQALLPPYPSASSS
ncbi:metallophosphoesterase family protein [Lujinxingia litoralis]|nr:metallophosphoesterase [Lujinxingia litoralis]